MGNNFLERRPHLEQVTINVPASAVRASYMDADFTRGLLASEQTIVWMEEMLKAATGVTVKVMPKVRLFSEARSTTADERCGIELLQTVCRNQK